MMPRPMKATVVIVKSSLSAELRGADGPGVRLIAEREAESGPAGDMHPTFLDLQSLVEKRVQPVEVLHPGFDRVGRGEVQVDLHREMRGEFQVLRLGVGGEFEELGDA